MILKTQQIKSGATDSQNQAKKGKKRKKRQEDQIPSENGEFFMNPEEEFIAEVWHYDLFNIFLLYFRNVSGIENNA